MHKAVEGKQPVKSKCDCRDNKLEKTKGDWSLHILVGSVQFFFFFSDCPDFTGNKNAWEFDFIGLVFARRQHPGSVSVSLREA